MPELAALVYLHNLFCDTGQAANGAVLAVVHLEVL